MLETEIKELEEASKALEEACIKDTTSVKDNLGLLESINDQRREINKISNTINRTSYDILYKTNEAISNRSITLRRSRKGIKLHNLMFLEGSSHYLYLGRTTIMSMMIRQRSDTNLYELDYIFGNQDVWDDHRDRHYYPTGSTKPPMDQLTQDTLTDIQSGRLKSQPGGHFYIMTYQGHVESYSANFIPNIRAFPRNLYADLELPSDEQLINVLTARRKDYSAEIISW